MIARLRPSLLVAGATTALMLASPGVAHAQTQAESQAGAPRYVINTAQERDQIDFYDTARWSAQMITPTRPNIAGVGFRLGFLPPPVCTPECVTPPPISGYVTYSLWTDNPSLPTSTQLATAIVPYTLTPYVSAWVDAYWNPVPVEVGRIYWLTIGNGSPQVKVYVLGGPPFPVYEGGDPRRGGLSETDPYVVHNTTAGPRFDLTFRTFAVPAHSAR